MEPKVTYRKSEGLVVLENSGGLRLIFGDIEIHSTHWMISEDGFQQLREQNPGVKFAKATVDSQ